MAILPAFSRTSAGFRRLTPADFGEVHAFLARDPVSNAFLLGWLEFHGLPEDRFSGDFHFVGVWNDTHLGCVALLVAGQLCMVSHWEGDPYLAADVGEYCVRHRLPLRTLTGPRAAIDEMWGRIRVSGGFVRRSLPQTLLHLRPRDLRYWGEPALELAGTGDLDELTRLSRDMHEEESGMELRGAEREAFELSVVVKVEEGRVWCVRDPSTGHVLFKGCLSVSSALGAQVEGIYTRPDVRRTGLARRAVSELCRGLLQRHDRVVLWCGVDNTPALGLYARLGFQPAGPWVTTHVGGLGGRTSP